MAGGEASLDGLQWLNDDTFQAVSSPGTGMGMAAQRLVGEGVGTFDMNVLNLGREPERKIARRSRPPIRLPRRRQEAPLRLTC